MSSGWIVSEQALDRHFGSLKAIIDQAVDAGVETGIVAEWGVAPVSVGLVGKGCELATRNRGGDAYVAPLFGFSGGIWAWLGFYQEWEREGPAQGTRRKYSYRSTTLSIHLGFPNMRHKPQIFRAEWAGLAKWNGGTYGAQAGNAGHPHWQFDAIESLRRQETEELVCTYLAVLKQEADGAEARIFSPKAVQSEEIDDLVWATDFSRIHFASVAPWWKDAPDDQHAYFPASVGEVEAWVQRTIGYTLEELGRLH